MIVRGKLTVQEAYGLRRLVLTRGERLSRYGLSELLAAALICLSIRVSMDYRHPFSGRSITVIWLIAIAAVPLAIFFRRRRERQDLARFIDALPQEYRLGNSVTVAYTNGVTASVPWKVVAGWRAIGDFVLLGKPNTTMPVPLGHLSADEREALITTLKSRLAQLPASLK